MTISRNRSDHRPIGRVCEDDNVTIGRSCLGPRLEKSCILQGTCGATPALPRPGSGVSCATASSPASSSLRAALPCSWTSVDSGQQASLRPLRFRRQHIIAGFIVDFYCPELRLAVEVDGPHHQLQRSEDEFRTFNARGRRKLRPCSWSSVDSVQRTGLRPLRFILGGYGVSVVRVQADAVMADVQQVVQFLRDVVSGKVELKPLD